MHRPAPFLSPRISHIRASIAGLAAQIGKKLTEAAAAALRVTLESALKQAERQQRRGESRWRRFRSYQVNGLNGPRAVARRRRQIEAGTLTWANGLVEDAPPLAPDLNRLGTHGDWRVRHGMVPA